MRENNTTVAVAPRAAATISGVNYPAVSVAASVESFYRSALNAMLNQRLTGARAPLFPSMHVQVPARVVYIAGFKGLRAYFDRTLGTSPSTAKVSSKTAPAPPHPSLMTRVAAMCAPGVLMTPVSSFLEACNAGHSNAEPLAKRSLRGAGPRGIREVIFGIGINPLSEYFEGRFRRIADSTGRTWVPPLATNMAGSLAAGVIAGYLSHVPHNMSTYKLLHPEKSYAEHFRAFVEKSAPSRDAAIMKRVPTSLREPARVAMACVAPRGVGIRTTQIVGSFVILNATILGIQTYEKRFLSKSRAAKHGRDA